MEHISRNIDALEYKSDLDNNIKSIRQMLNTKGNDPFGGEGPRQFNFGVRYNPDKDVKGMNTINKIKGEIASLAKSAKMKIKSITTKLKRAKGTGSYVQVIFSLER